MFKTKISKDEVKKLERLKFDGKIHIITKNDELPPIIEKLSQYKQLGFDTETKPVYRKKGKRDVSLLQIATEKEAFLFRLNFLSYYNIIFSILSNPEILKIGVAINGDLKDLKKLKDFNPSNFLELQKYVKNFNIKNISLRKMGAIVLNGKISKRQQRSNWEAPVLTKAQLRYAATDAWASLMIYKKLKSSLNN